MSDPTPVSLLQVKEISQAKKNNQQEKTPRQLAGR